MNPFKDLQIPSSDISFIKNSGKDGNLIIAMKFLNFNLELSFSNPITIKWEREFHKLVGLPKNLKKIENEDFYNWVYPIQIIKNSTWADLYAGKIYSEEKNNNPPIKHYALFSMNDLLHVLSDEDPKIQMQR